MKKNVIVSGGLVHMVPTELQKIFFARLDIYKLWENISPLARNEWLCWILSAKKVETKDRRIKIMLENLLAGKHRPCCWAGCIHRK